MIEKITLQEFELVKAPTAVMRPLSAETVAIRQLAVGDAIKMPCRWQHKSHHNSTKGTGCGGRAAAYYAARVEGFRVRTRCQDKTLYVMRLA